MQCNAYIFQVEIRPILLVILIYLLLFQVWNLNVSYWKQYSLHHWWEYSMLEQECSTIPRFPYMFSGPHSNYQDS